MPLCFPIWDYMMLPQRTVSFKFCPMQAHPRAYVYIIYEKTKGKFPRENQVVWIGKTKHTSLRRSITLHWLTFQTPLSQVTYVVTGRRDHWREQLSSRRATLSAQLLIKQLKFGYEFSGNISVTLKDFDCQLRIWRPINDYRKHKENTRNLSDLGGRVQNSHTEGLFTWSWGTTDRWGYMWRVTSPNM